MNRLLYTLNWTCFPIVAGMISFSCVSAQETQPNETKYRKLAPWVMTSIDPMRQMEEAFSRHDIVELAAEDPAWELVRDVPFRQDVWALEFKFKPVRMIWVDVPQPGGIMKKKLIWYMVYSVTNPGKVVHPIETAAPESGPSPETTSPSDEIPLVTRPNHFLDPAYKEGVVKMSKPGAPATPFFPRTYTVRYVDKPVKFIPEFMLVSHAQDVKMPDPNGAGQVKAYRDRVIPVALVEKDGDGIKPGPIPRREDPRRQFLNTVQMTHWIEPGQTLWGVATWVDIDPKIDRFSIYVKGLTNAYRWVDAKENRDNSTPLLAGRRILVKTLKLNFWRPGDEFDEHEGEIRFGIPERLDPGGVDYEWVLQ